MGTIDREAPPSPPPCVMLAWLEVYLVFLEGWAKVLSFHCQDEGC